MAAGEPQEAHIYSDAKAAYDWVRRDLGVRTGTRAQPVFWVLPWVWCAHPHSHDMRDARSVRVHGWRCRTCCGVSHASLLNADHIILYGKSLGTAATIDLGTRVPSVRLVKLACPCTRTGSAREVEWQAGVVLVSPLASGARVVFPKVKNPFLDKVVPRACAQPPLDTPCRFTNLLMITDFLGFLPVGA